MRRLALVLTTTLVGGAGAWAGAYALGAGLGTPGFLAGWAAGGALGAGAAAWGCRRGEPPAWRRAVARGAAAGAVLALPVAFFTFVTVVGPVLACALIGVRALIADVDAAARSASGTAPAV
jgi:hypothetical protein